MLTPHHRIRQQPVHARPAKYINGVEGGYAHRADYHDYRQNIALHHHPMVLRQGLITSRETIWDRAAKRSGTERFAQWDSKGAMPL
jgi:hypothetical protein